MKDRQRRVCSVWVAVVAVVLSSAVVPERALLDIPEATATPVYLGMSVAGADSVLDASTSGSWEARAVLAVDTYTLATAAIGSGVVTITPNQPAYVAGSVVQLTASPGAGWHFAGWSGDLSGTSNPAFIAMNGNRGVAATFEPGTVGSIVISDSAKLKQLDYFNPLPTLGSPPVGMANAVSPQYVYNMGDIVHGTVLFTSVVEGASWTTRLVAVDTETTVDQVTSVQVAGTYGYLLQVGTANVPQDGPYDLIVSDADETYSTRVFIRYNLTWRSSTIRSTSGFSTIEGWMTRGNGQTVTCPVTIGVTYPCMPPATTVARAGTYTISAMSSGQFSMTFAVDPATQLGVYRVFVRDGYDAVTPTIPDNDAMIYQKLSNGVGPYIIAAIAGANGTITPNGVFSVAGGASQAFQIVPDTGYCISSLVDNGVVQAVTNPDSLTYNPTSASTSVTTTSSAPDGSTATRTIALAFLGSPEYALRARTNIQFIEDCYNGILRRGALAAEIQYWVDFLAAGHTRIETLNYFVDSLEFQTRVDELIAAGPFVP